MRDSIKKCRVCYGENLSPVIDLGFQPWGNNFLRLDEIGQEPTYPLRVVFCNSCSTIQLDHTVKKEVMFADHTYLSGITSTLNEHFKRIASYVDTQFGEIFADKNILDIGSNDGTQLKHYQKLGWDALGVESSSTIARMANDNGVPTLNKFFNLKCLEDINMKFSVINAAGVFFHLEELHSVTEAIKKGLKTKGVFVVQFLYIKSILDNNAFDQIYHEHLLYYSLKTLNKLLSLYNLSIFDAFLTETHGGQMVAFVSHKGTFKKSLRLNTLIADEEKSKCNEKSSYLKFSQRITRMKDANLEFLLAAKKECKKVYGMGAPVKGNTLLNYFGVKSDLIKCLLEKNPLRKGLFAPGSHIPIYLEDEVKERADIYYVLAWNFKKEILARNKKLIREGCNFYFPIEMR